MAVTFEQDRAGTTCLCGKRKSLSVVIEFTDRTGKVDYVGGRFCYDHGHQICFAVPEGAVFREVRLFDWSAPDEVLRVTASARPGALP